MAVIRSDDVVFVGEVADAATLSFVARFAIEHRRRSVQVSDFDGVTAVLVANGDVGMENRIVRHARRAGIPLYVDARPLVSDFTRLELLERSASSVRRAVPTRPSGLDASSIPPRAP